MKRLLLAIAIGMISLGLVADGQEALAVRPSATNVELTPNLPSGQLVGTTIIWMATTDSPDPMEYRLSIGLAGDSLRVMYDFSPSNVFTWTPIDDGTYDVVLSVKEAGSDQVTHAATTYVVTSRVDSTPKVSPTQHPLVALYSAPPIDSGKMRVVFRRRGSLVAYSTNWKPSRPGHSMNFYIAGMRADSVYLMRHEIADDDGVIVERGPVMLYRTGSLPLDFPAFQVIHGPNRQTSFDDPVLLYSPVSMETEGAATYPVATDFAGEVIWYYEAPQGTCLYRPVEGGTMFLVARGESLPSQRLLEVDLAGNTVRETNVSRINEQLAALGQDPIGSFHHECVRFPNGQTLVLAKVERIMTDVQGPGPIDILGDMVIALDDNWQVLWAWNAFDHLDVTRKATLGETCGPGKVCPPLLLAEEANDWLHTNSIAYSPADGNLIISMRNQDWVVKIDYQDGTGSGDVIWKLGLEGDFTMLSDDPYPWFTHQHDARYISDNQIILYDNGTLRCMTSPNPRADCYSRGQVLNIDEENLVASLDLNVNLQNYSPGFGAAQTLSNGNFHFSSGYNYPRMFGTSDEVLADGTKVYSVKTPEFLLYRSFRMKSLYTP